MFKYHDYRQYLYIPTLKHFPSSQLNMIFHLLTPCLLTVHIFQTLSQTSRWTQSFLGSVQRVKIICPASSSPPGLHPYTSPVPCPVAHITFSACPPKTKGSLPHHISQCSVQHWIYGPLTEVLPWAPARWIHHRGGFQDQHGSRWANRAAKTTNTWMLNQQCVGTWFVNTDKEKLQQMNDKMPVYLSNHIKNTWQWTIN